jgi:hypothetical protein
VRHAVKSLELLLTAYVAWHLEERRRSRAVVPDTFEARVAVHETGHLVVAWSSIHIDKVLRVSIEGAGGKPGDVAGNVAVHYDARFMDTTSGFWWELVLMLGGAAAEMMTFGSAVGHTRDIERAHVVSEQLAKNGLIMADAPFTTLRGKKIGLPIMEGSAAGIALIRSAFTYAWATIERRQSAFDRLVSMLLAKKVLSEEDVKSVLGSRWAVRLLTNVLAKKTP